MEDENGEYKIARGDAERWESNDEGTVWTFYLADNKWEDGEPVTAEQYVYSLRRSSAPETGSPNSFFLDPILNFKAVNTGELPVEELGVRAVDEFTLEITLTDPLPSFLSMIDTTCYYPQREDKVTEWGEKYGSEAKYTISNGAFKIAEWNHNASVLLEKNEHFWNAENVILDKIHYDIMTDETTRYNAYESGHIDFVGVSTREYVDKFKADGNSTYTSYTAQNITFIVFNIHDAIFQNANIRKAITLAIDREDMNEMCYSGLMVPTYGFVVPTISVGELAFRSEVGDPILELKAAVEAEGKTPKDLLLEGMAELGLGDDPATVDMVFQVGGTSNLERTIGEYLQQVFAEELGLDLKIDLLDWGIFLNNVLKGEHQVSLISYGAYYNDPFNVLSMFATDFDLLSMKWGNDEFDELMYKGSIEMDDRKRLEYYAAAERLVVYEDAIVAPIITSTVQQFSKNYVNNFPVLGFSKKGYRYGFTSGRP